MCELLLCSDDLATLESFAYGDTPSKSSVRRMLDSFFEGMVKSDGIDVGTGFSKKDGTLGEVQVGLFGLGRDVDMRDTVLKTMLAQLDISFGLVTEITPMYGQYEICAVQPGWEMRNESVGDPIWGAFGRSSSRPSSAIF